MKKQKLSDCTTLGVPNAGADFIIGLQLQADGKTYKNVKIPASALGGVRQIGYLNMDFSKSTDQAITLFGGNSYIITDIVITNAALTSASGFQVWSQANKAGTQLASCPSLTRLAAKNNFVNNTNAVSILTDDGIKVSTMFATVSGVESTTSLGDVLVFGYALQ